ncbi:MAG: hypothetical protein HZA54_18670 [Planctomycetes bacterium]|nr:hypothetical protein [Planctomycetota bacterium]
MLDRRATEDLRVIRTLMERSATYELLSARAGVGAGAMALAGAGFLALTRRTDAESCGLVWAGVFLASLASTVWCVIQRGQERNEPVWSPQARAVVTALLPPFLVGWTLSVFFFARGEHLLLPGVWMLCYACGALATATYAPEPIRGLGLAMLGFGTLTLALPPAYGNLMMGIAFGFGHLALAAALERRDRRVPADTPAASPLPTGWRLLRGGARDGDPGGRA